MRISTDARTGCVRIPISSAADLFQFMALRCRTGGNFPARAVRPTIYEQLLATIFTDCTSRRRSEADDEERFCSSVVTAVVPVVPVVAVVVVAADELEAGASFPVTVILWPT
jgi:hypothetical protein